jgi:hypothetical protein
LRPVAVAGDGQDDDGDQRKPHAPAKRNGAIADIHEEHHGDQSDEPAPGSGAHKGRRQERERGDTQPALISGARAMNHIQRDRHRRDDEGRKIVRVVIVEIAEAPGVAFPEIESRDDHRGINRGRREIRHGETFNVANAPDTCGDDEEHQEGLDEITEQQIEAGAADDGARGGESDPEEQRDHPLRRWNQHPANTANAARVAEEQQHRERAHQDGRTKQRQHREQLMDATDGNEDVSCNTDHQDPMSDPRDAQRAWRRRFGRPGARQRC